MSVIVKLYLIDWNSKRKPVLWHSADTCGIQMLNSTPNTAVRKENRKCGEKKTLVSMSFFFLVVVVSYTHTELQKILKISLRIFYHHRNWKSRIFKKIQHVSINRIDSSLIITQDSKYFLTNAISSLITRRK